MILSMILSMLPQAKVLMKINVKEKKNQRRYFKRLEIPFSEDILREQNTIFIGKNLLRRNTATFFIKQNFLFFIFILIENSTHPSGAPGGREIEGGGNILQKISTMVH